MRALVVPGGRHGQLRLGEEFRNMHLEHAGDRHQRGQRRGGDAAFDLGDETDRQARAFGDMFEGQAEFTTTRPEPFAQRVLAGGAVAFACDLLVHNRSLDRFSICKKRCLCRCHESSRILVRLKL
jgi:hypothetical protein